MIIKETSDRNFILYEPENIKERKALDSFPGFFREGLSFYSPVKQNVVYNLVQRLKKKHKDLKISKFVHGLVNEPMKILDIPEDFIFHTEPLPHQRIALRFAYTFRSLGLLLEPGLGKTKVVLDYIYLSKASRSLIICPLALVEVWVDEVAKHRPELSIYVVKSTNWQEEFPKAKAADIVVVNYNKAVTLEENLIGLNFSFVAIDEGLIKNHATDRTKSITRIGRGIPSRVVMSGTLVNNSALDTFAPIRFIEPSLVGVAWTRFKERYTKSSNKNKNIIIGVYDIPEIKSILHACSVVMTKAEWLKDLPPKEFHPVYVQMSDQQRFTYHDLANNYLTTLPTGDEIEVSNALSLMSKLYQIANGFVYINKEQDIEALDELGLPAKKKYSIKDRKTYIFEEQPKIRELLSLTADRHRFESRRAIIWFNMGCECDLIENALNRRGDTFLTIRGGDPELASKVKAFNTDPSIRWLVCQAKTINYGQTIMGSNDEESFDEEGLLIVPEFSPTVSDEIFYSLNFSLEMFLQQQDRIHRIGQRKKCNYWILLTNCSVEKKTLKTIESKQICSREILEDIASSAKLDFM